jgi:inner membrane transporter RhtA
MVALGIVFATMNYSFYHAIDRLPLGIVAAIEFIGSIALAVNGARTRRNALALGSAVVGVVLLTDIRIAGDPGAFVWAFTNAGLFMLYIVLAHRIANADPASSPIDRLGASMMVAAIAIAPFGVLHAGAAFRDPAVLLAGIGVGITSSVIPYVFDQLAMARLARSTYALFIALLPATAVIIGVIVLAQIPHPIEIAAVGLVVIGVAIHKEPP